MFFPNGPHYRSPYDPAECAKITQTLDTLQEYTECRTTWSEEEWRVDECAVPLLTIPRYITQLQGTLFSLQNIDRYLKSISDQDKVKGLSERVDFLKQAVLNTRKKLLCCEKDYKIDPRWEREIKQSFWYLTRDEVFSHNCYALIEELDKIMTKFQSSLNSDVRKLCNNTLKALHSIKWRYDISPSLFPQTNKDFYEKLLAAQTYVLKIAETASNYN